MSRGSGGKAASSSNAQAPTQPGPPDCRRWHPPLARAPAAAAAAPCSTRRGSSKSRRRQTSRPPPRRSAARWTSAAAGRGCGRARAAGGAWGRGRRHAAASRRWNGGAMHAWLAGAALQRAPLSAAAPGNGALPLTRGPAPGPRLSPGASPVLPLSDEGLLPPARRGLARALAGAAGPKGYAWSQRLASPGAHGLQTGSSGTVGARAGSGRQ